MGPLIEGIILGFTLAIFFGFGPALFALLQTTIHRGFLSGIFLAIGIFISDMVLVGLCLIGALQIISKPENNLAFAIISGIILIVFGIVTYSRKVEVDKNKKNKLKKNDAPWKITFVLKGFFLNFTNPFVWLFWIPVVVSVTSSYEGEKYSVTIFFAAALLTVLATDILKCFASSKIKKFLTQKIMQRINHFAGIGLILFGLFLIGRAIIAF